MGKFVPTKELREEVGSILKINKELEKATVAEIRKLKKLPIEQFKKEVCIRLEEIYKTLRNLGDEMIQGYLQDHAEGRGPVMKNGIQAEEDRKKVLAALRAEQAFEDADDKAKLLEEKVDEVYLQMVEGKDLKGLLELEKIFHEVKSSFSDDAYTIISGMLEDRIEAAKKDVKEAQS